MLTENTAASDTGNTNAEGASTAATPANADFMGSLPEDLQTNESLYGFEDLGGLAKSFVETKGQLSEQEKMIAELQGKVPRIPANASEYQLQLPEGMQAEEFSDFLQFAHEAGMSQEQVNKSLEFSMKQQQAAQQRTMEAEANAIGSLKSEWGDSFEANAKMAASAVTRFGGDELKAFLDSSRLGNNPQLVKMFHKISVAISEDSLLTGNTNQSHKERNLGIDGKPMLSFPSMEKTQ